MHIHKKIIFKYLKQMKRKTHPAVNERYFKIRQYLYFIIYQFSFLFKNIKYILW